MQFMVKAATHPEEPPIVITGTCEPRSGGKRRTLRSLHPEPKRDSIWFGARIGPDDNEICFDIPREAIERMPAPSPTKRGQLLVDALLDWLAAEPGRKLKERNHFRVSVAEAGEVRVAPWHDDEPVDEARRAAEIAARREADVDALIGIERLAARASDVRVQERIRVLYDSLSPATRFWYKRRTEELLYGDR